MTGGHQGFSSQGRAALDWTALIWTPGDCKRSHAEAAETGFSRVEVIGPDQEAAARKE